MWTIPFYFLLYSALNLFLFGFRSARAGKIRPFVSYLRAAVKLSAIGLALELTLQILLDL